MWERTRQAARKTPAVADFSTGQLTLFAPGLTPEQSMEIKKTFFYNILREESSWTACRNAPVPHRAGPLGGIVPEADPASRSRSKLRRRYGN
jgi:hypothetical protein